MPENLIEPPTILAEPAEPTLIRREADVLRDLVRLAEERSLAESNIASSFASRKIANEREFNSARQGATAQYKTRKETIERESQAARQAFVARHQADKAAAEKDYLAKHQGIVTRFEADTEGAAKLHEETRWEAMAVYEAARDEMKKKFETLQGEVVALLQTLRPLQDDAREVLERCAPLAGKGESEGEPPTLVDDDPVRTLNDAITDLDAKLYELKTLFLPKFLGWDQFSLIFFALGLALIVPGVWIWGWAIGLAAGLAGAAAIGFLIRAVLTSIARSQVARLHAPLARAVGDSEVLSQLSTEWVKGTYKRLKAENEQRRERKYRQADELFEQATAQSRQARERDLPLAEETYAQLTTEIEQRRDRDLRQLEEKFARLVIENDQKRDEDERQVVEKNRNQVERNAARFESEWTAMAARWKEGMTRALAEVEAINGEVRDLFPAWNSPDWSRWTAAEAVPPVLPFGEIEVDLSRIPGGVPRDERLKIGPTRLSLPAVLPFHSRGSLLFRTSDEGRENAVESLQDVMMRMLTGLPPGKVRFTIVDPVGLGRNFAAFMHLTDYDEALVSSRIFTESAHIEQRLADLTEHMENVIQKYLRNEFQTIEEYNAHAGEVAEPFRILVVANFPTNFTEAAARRLLSIASSGARCGVHTLITVDTKQPPPPNFPMKDLERHATTLVWDDGRFVWRGSEFEDYPLQLEKPPGDLEVTRILHEVGVKARDAKRVEVPFEVIAPAADRWWTGDSRPGIDVPLGKAGATRLQHLKLGRGTSQHVLIAGKTGSGKSTLLHALITNLALHYSPDEVEFYLIDFKKGVEFKTYATHELPHARVIAVESEREFGLSVLQRLDVELKLRGDRFRDVGAQDLAAFRNFHGNKIALPRILLIVDEFQEFFVEDDKLGQEAALLLDRLVRQGRAFGIHIHLGSQTLSGAYSLARSTLGQMAVRIALQCSESDAHLILSEDNSAARLLSRPGEAIYNDANGIIEGNHFFQIVWLPDERREDYLKRLRQLARDRGYVARPQIVFEGNTPADIRKNPKLDTLLRSDASPGESKAPLAWLGEAIAIKDPTAAVFRDQGGSNLIIVGQNDELALGILATSLVGLAAQHSPEGASFYVMDGTPSDFPAAGTLARLADVVPQSMRAIGSREAATVLGEITEELARRQQAEASSDFPSIYLFIHDLARFRDLRKSDDDFGFSRMGEDQAASPTQQFAAILRDGPPLGIHSLIWCDTMNNVNRSLDRQGLREFEMRVLFQMNAGDSSNLIDSPLATKLGPHRAFYSSEEQGVLEKFRPYSAPPADWLEWAKERLHGRRTADIV